MPLRTEAHYLFGAVVMALTGMVVGTVILLYGAFRSIVQRKNGDPR